MNKIPYFLVPGVFVVILLCSLIASIPPATNIIRTTEVVNGDQLFLNMRDGSEILIELEDEDNTYLFAYRGEEYELFFVNVCDAPIGDVQECASYVMFDGKNMFTPYVDSLER